MIEKCMHTYVKCEESNDNGRYVPNGCTQPDDKEDRPEALGDLVLCPVDLSQTPDAGEAKKPPIDPRKVQFSSSFSDGVVSSSSTFSKFKTEIFPIFTSRGNP